MNIPLLGRAIDERFFTHRQRSTSIAGAIAALLAILLFAYRFYIDHVWSWDLLAIGVTFGAVKLACMTWYYLTE